MFFQSKKLRPNLARFQSQFQQDFGLNDKNNLAGETSGDLFDSIPGLGRLMIMYYAVTMVMKLIFWMSACLMLVALIRVKVFVIVVVGKDLIAMPPGLATNVAMLTKAIGVAELLAILADLANDMLVVMVAVSVMVMLMIMLESRIGLS